MNAPRPVPSAEVQQTDPRRNVGMTVVLRPVATPLSLAFAALAVGTFVVAGLELAWIPPDQAHDVGLICLAFTAPLQLIGVLVGFWARDPVAATGVGILSGSWACIGLVLHGSTPGVAHGGLGLLLVGSAATLLIPTAVALETKALAGVVMATASARFAVTGGYELSGDHAVEVAAGIVGLVLAAVAAYAALAFELEGAQSRVRLPTLRRGQGQAAMTAGLSDDVADIEHEAGVRSQL